MAQSYSARANAVLESSVQADQWYVPLLVAAFNCVYQL